MQIATHILEEKTLIQGFNKVIAIYDHAKYNIRSHVLRGTLNNENCNKTFSEHNLYATDTFYNIYNVS